MFLFVSTTCQGKDPITEVIKSQVPYLIPEDIVIPLWMAIVINFISLAATFVWNYLDVFISVISIGISTLFELYNAELHNGQDVRLK